jgi:hypothetical protein
MTLLRKMPKKVAKTTMKGTQYVLHCMTSDFSTDKGVRKQSEAPPAKRNRSRRKKAKVAADWQTDSQMDSDSERPPTDDEKSESDEGTSHKRRRVAPLPFSAQKVNYIAVGFQCFKAVPQTQSRTVQPRHVLAPKKRIEPRPESSPSAAAVNDSNAGVSGGATGNACQETVPGDSGADVYGGQSNPGSEDPAPFTHAAPQQESNTTSSNGSDQVIVPQDDMDSNTPDKSSSRSFILL